MNFNTPLDCKPGIRKQYAKNFDGGIIRSSLNYFTNHGITKQYSVKCVFSGVEHYCIDQTWHTVKANQCLLVPPGVNLVTEVDSETRAEGLCLYLDERLLCSMIQNELSHEIMTDSGPVSNCFDALTGHVINLSGDDLLRITSKINYAIFANPDDLLISFSEHYLNFSSRYAKRISRIVATKKSTKKELAVRVEVGRQFMHENLSQKISLRHIAQSACISPYHFHRVFTKMYKKSPHAYLHKLRIEKAQNLIKSNKASECEIARQCGFFDVAYMKKCLSNGWN